LTLDLNYNIRVTCLSPGNTIGGSITVQLTSCLTGLDKSVLKIEIKIVSCHKADSKPVKQEVDGIVVLTPLVFPALSISKIAGKEEIEPHEFSENATKFYLPYIRRDNLGPTIDIQSILSCILNTKSLRLG
jgi:hypothetical protein